MLLPVVALQTAVPPPDRISILIPVVNQRCPRATRARTDGDIIVCAERFPAQKLPLPSEAISPLPQPVNRDMNGVGALAAESAPCAARIGGCTVGVNVFGAATALVRGVQKLVAPNSCCEEPGEATNAGELVRAVGRGMTHAFRHKPDTSKRVPIALDEPDMQGRVLP